MPPRRLWNAHNEHWRQANYYTGIQMCSKKEWLCAGHIALDIISNETNWKMPWGTWCDQVGLCMCAQLFLSSNDIIEQITFLSWAQFSLKCSHCECVPLFETTFSCVCVLSVLNCLWVCTLWLPRRRSSGSGGSSTIIATNNGTSDTSQMPLFYAF